MPVHTQCTSSYLHGETMTGSMEFLCHGEHGTCIADVALRMPRTFLYFVQHMCNRDGPLGQPETICKVLDPTHDTPNLLIAKQRYIFGQTFTEFLGLSLCNTRAAMNYPLSALKRFAKYLTNVCPRCIFGQTSFIPVIVREQWSI